MKKELLKLQIENIKLREQIIIDKMLLQVAVYKMEELRDRLEKHRFFDDHNSEAGYV